MINKKTCIKMVFNIDYNIVDYSVLEPYEELIVILGVAGVVDKFGGTALMYAAFEELENVVDFLIEYGVDVNKTSKTPYNYTALDLAKETRDKTIIKKLKDAGAKTFTQMKKDA